MFQGKRKANQAKADAKAPAKRQTKKTHLVLKET